MAKKVEKEDPKKQIVITAQANDFIVKMPRSPVLPNDPILAPRKTTPASPTPSSHKKKN